MRARTTSREHSGSVCVGGRGTRCCVCSNVSISITTPQRQSPHNIGRAGLLPALRVREILIINNGRVPSQGGGSTGRVRTVHIQAEGRREREREQRRKRKRGSEKRRKRGGKGDDRREGEGERDERGGGRRMGSEFGMPRYRETEENESSAIGAYYGSHVLFW